MSGGGGYVIDRVGGGGTCHTDPSGCIVYVGAGLRVCDCDGTVGVGIPDGIGMLAMGLCPGVHTFGGMFTMCDFPAAVMFASICGSEMVVNSSHGTDGSRGGAVANSGAPTLRSVW
jgi:hypothetical protein